MKVKAKRTKEGFLIPFLAGLENEEEIEVIIQIKEKYAETPTDDYVEKNWKTLLLNATRSPYIEDNEIITEAHKEYKDDKGSS